MMAEDQQFMSSVLQSKYLSVKYTENLQETLMRVDHRKTSDIIEMPDLNAAS